MATTQNLAFSHKEIAEALVRSQDIHEGLWGLYVEFGLSATNMQVGSEDNLVPAAILSIVKLGIQKFDKPNNLTVDAAIVNPAKRKASEKK